MRILITGGAGFIGSHVAEAVAAEYPRAEIVVFDKMTYAADYENIAHLLVRGRRWLVVGDLCDFEKCMEITVGVDVVMHLAAESHVDNSFGNSILFTRSNTLGTHTLLEACRLNGVGRIIHVSTDEVFGETRDGSHTEADSLNPTNPYSASKAAAEMVVNGYLYSFKLPIITVRANNMFGIRQFPEKIIPRFCMLAFLGRQFTLHGTGQNLRYYLSAADFARAMITILEKGAVGTIYNVASEDEYSNLEVRDLIAEAFGIDGEANTTFIQDRPFNDYRYSIVCDRLLALGWRQRLHLKDEMPAIAAWYRDNAQRYTHVF